MDGTDEVGIWVTNELDGSAGLLAVDAVANEFTDWGDGRTTDAHSLAPTTGPARPKLARVVDLQEAWTELHSATPPGWYVGPPNQRHGGQWAIYALDTTEKAHIGKRSREWTAVGQTEVECVREMARCLREISEGGVPK